MADFKQAIPFILMHEGGYAETAAGEIVNRGVNTDTLKALGYKGTKDELKQIVKNLTVQETEDIYFKYYWTLQRQTIPDALNQLHSQSAANKILDMAVLSGQRTAIKLVQRSLGLKDDGDFGPKTLAAAQAEGDALAKKLATTWSQYLADIADKRIAKAQADNKPDLEKYWKQVRVGWLARASWDGVDPRGNSL